MVTFNLIPLQEPSLGTLELVKGKARFKDPKGL